MKLGEIKIEALKLMFPGYAVDMTVETMQQKMRDENYKNYYAKMPGVINRCFSCIESKRVMPVKVIHLAKEDGTLSNDFLRFDLSTLLSDFCDIERISGVFDGMYLGDADFFMEGDTLLLRKDANDISVMYYPSIPRISGLTPEDMPIAVPDYIASHIPYFIKGELYRDDEPNEASEARNWFEAAMAELTDRKTAKGALHISRYAMEEL